MIEAALNRIGSKIRQLRREHGFSTKELSERTGVSTAAINKIERSQMYPTISTLMKIANGLETQVSFFFEEYELLDDRGFEKSKERKTMNNPSSKAVFERIAMPLRNCMIDAGFSAIEPGGSSGRDHMKHPGEEIIYCMEGEIEVIIEHEKYILQSGDCIHFKSSLPHRWKNKKKTKAKILGIVTPPPFLR